MFRRVGPKIAVAILAAVVSVWAAPVRAAEAPGSIQGVVKSSSGQPLYGAYVKLINAEKHLTFLVVSKSQGHYKVNDLPPGKYMVQSIGGGFQSVPKPVEVTAGQPATLNVSLTTPQPAERPGGWPGSPGRVGGNEIWVHEKPPVLPDGPGKQILETTCSQCHELWRVALLRFHPHQWRVTIARMRGYIHEAHAKDLTDAQQKVLLDYLIGHFNGGPGSITPLANPNSRFPRTLVKGSAADYEIVDYSIPTPDVKSHDIAVDSSGNGWLVQDIGCCIDKFDPTTYTFTRVIPPAPAKGTTQMATPIIQGAGDTMWMSDEGGRRWLNLNTKTMKWTIYPFPDSITGNVSSNAMAYNHMDGTVWATGTGSNRIFGLNPKTKKWVSYDVPHYVKTKENTVPYGMAISGDGKVWFAERNVDLVGRLDPATGKIDEFPVPADKGDVSIPRRMGTDTAGNIWVALHQSGKLVKFDYETTKMTVYTPPTPNNGIYSVVGDPKSGVIWFSEQGSDMMGRFDPKTDKFTEYAMPNAEIDVRRIEIDKNNPNRIWWTGDTSNQLGYFELQQP
jgi:virginiamycin B lyase